MADEFTELDDPDLKAAVRRLRAGHTARPDLRDRVVRRLTELRVQTGATRTPESASPVRPVAAGPWRSLRRLAVTAIVLLTIGAPLGYRHYQRTLEASAEQARNSALLGAMVAIHDIGRGTASGLQPLAAPLSDAKAVATEAGRMLGRPIPAVDLSARGWTLDAADLCTVGTARSVRFHFTRGSRSISVISIPNSAYATTNAGHYEVNIGEHPIAGCVKSGSLTFVVGDPACGMGDTIALRDAIRDQ
ncbi:MAG: hypothetical protein ACHRHE_17830 [Tepidisphaerales bacterium]